MATIGRDTSPFGQRLRKFRRERGLTQVELSHELDVSQRTVSSYETGVAWPSPPTLMRIARILETSVDELLGLKRNRSSHVPEMSVSTSRLWKRVKRIENLSRRSQKKVLEVLDAMLEKYEVRGDAE